MSPPTEFLITFANVKAKFLPKVLLRLKFLYSLPKMIRVVNFIDLCYTASEQTLKSFKIKAFVVSQFIKPKFRHFFPENW